MPRSSLLRLVVAATPLMHAHDVQAAPPSGCFERVYSERHMRDHPKQIVRRLIVSVGWNEESQQNMVGVKTWLRGKRQVWHAGGPCAVEADTWNCHPDTDGDPNVSAVMKGSSLEFSNPKRLKVFDDVTGPGLNDAQVEGPANAVFLLTRTDPAKCSTQ